MCEQIKQQKREDGKEEETLLDEFTVSILYNIVPKRRTVFVKRKPFCLLVICLAFSNVRRNSASYLTFHLMQSRALIEEFQPRVFAYRRSL